MSIKDNTYEVSLEGKFATRTTVHSSQPKDEVERIVSQAFKDQMETLEITIVINQVKVENG